MKESNLSRSKSLDTLFLYNWKPQWSNMNSVTITNNDHSLMKGGNSALGRYLMDVAILVAWSCANSLPFMFVHPYLVVWTKSGTAPVWRGRPASRWYAWPGTPMPVWPEVSFPLEQGKKQVCLYLCMKKLAFFCISLSWNVVFEALMSCLFWCFNYWVQ